MRGFPHSSLGKSSACNAGDLGSIPGSGRSPGEGNGNPLQYSCLQNPMDRGYSPWGHKGSDTTLQLNHHHVNIINKHPPGYLRKCCWCISITLLWRVCLVWLCPSWMWHAGSEFRDPGCLHWCGILTTGALEKSQFCCLCFLFISPCWISG